MNATLLNRLRAMDGAEIRYRAKSALRTRLGRAKSTFRAAEWRRESLQLASVPGMLAAREALERKEWLEAHTALAVHFARRPALFPLDPRTLSQLASRVVTAFPEIDPRSRAERILSGHYDLLGYRDVLIPSPPDWHRDPVHDRAAPMNFWDAVPYLDPGCGDHKITWELNRHQHFMVLGRAFALSGDRRYYAEFVSQLLDWIRRNPPLVGTNWSSMLEVAFRTLSWTWALHFFAGAASRQDAEPWTVDLLLALDRQLAHVADNLSLYFSPNTHLTGEALALYVTGRVLPELNGSKTRSALGRQVLLDEAGRQILADGAHAERSTHYHRYSTDFYLFAFNVARASGDPHAAELRDPALRQARFLRAIADDSGRIPLIGDDDGGQLFPICGRSPADCADTLATAALLLGEASLAVSPPPEETYWLCGQHPELVGFTPKGTPCFSMPPGESGYCVSRNTRGDHLVFDCGPHGYLNGGHAHADALAVVLTVAGKPLLVDPGTATYTMDPEVRDRFRSSAMHNTVVIGRRSQSEPSGPFHWKSRVDARCIEWESGPDRDHAVGQHDGYAPFRHSREITSIHGRGWTIVDRVEGQGHLEATAMWHFHPAWTLVGIDGPFAHLRHADGARFVFMSSTPLQASSSLGEYAPEYGCVHQALCLEATVWAAAPLSIVTVIPADGTRTAALDLALSLQLTGVSSEADTRT